VVADALARGADTLITCGSVQSNHCRLTASAAAMEGLTCRLALEERVPGSYEPAATGNNRLYHLLGVERIRVAPGGTDMNEVMRAMADEAESEGRNPYVIPLGAGVPLGVLGYVDCAHEMLVQAHALGVRLDAVVHASGGSGGTQAGLLIGFAESNESIPVIGICSGSPKTVQEQRVHELVQRTLAELDLPVTVGRAAINCLDEYVGPGYSRGTPEMAEAVRLLARTEGLLLDPVYTGKAMAGLIGLVRQGAFTPDQHVLFLHTGGTPALYHFPLEYFAESAKNET
jgi:D-cysteine desulfhydrase